MKLHTGDIVVVITGKDKGKTGRVLRVLPERERIVVAGINLRTKHIKKTMQSPGRILRFEGGVHQSNLMLVDPKTKKRTRVGYRMTDGKKERIAKKSGETLLSGQKLKKLVEEETKDSEKKAKNSSDGRS